MAEGAVKSFERVLAAGEETSASNRSQRRRARQLLSAVYMRRGETAKALGLYEALLQPELTGDLNFEGLYNSAVILTRMGGAEKTMLARDRFAEAQKLQPDFLDVELRLAALDYAGGKSKEAGKRIKAYLGKVPDDLQARVDQAILDITEGRFTKAENSLRKALDDTGNPEISMRARLGLGSIQELRGKLPEAEAHYRSAISLSTSNPLPGLMLATILVRQDRTDEAAELVTSIRSAHVARQAVFGACSRLQALIDARKGEAARSSSNLEFAVDVSPEDPAVLEAAGLAFLRQGKLEQGLSYLARANKLQEGRPATLNGLGYYNYIQGQHAEAAAFFDQTLAALKKSSPGKKGKETAFAKGAKAYAAHARNLVRDLDDLQVWVDEFESSAADLIDGWNEIELYGIDVAPAESNVVFKGRQQKSPDGESGIRLLRVYRSRDLERVAVRLRIDSGNVVPSLNLTGPDGTRSALSALSLYRDFDGRVRVRLRSNKGEWIEPEEPAAAGEGAVKGAAYVGNVTWAADTNFHTLEIRKARTSRGATRSNMFDLYFDGEPVAREVQVPGLSTSYQMSVMA
ncbi:MAG: tetratricopeptide repeat protein, partial [Planctomycetes bacterium]|nr:tetratricopeptide repeat protein [Planctomycetota bacterium]